MSIELQATNVLNTWLKYGIIKHKGETLVWSTHTLKEQMLNPITDQPEEAAQKAVEEYQNNYGVKK